MTMNMGAEQGMICLLSIVTLVCVCYPVLSLVRCGVPESLSATYYSLGKHGRLFQLVMFAVGVLLLPVWIGVSSEPYRHLCFLACGSLLFVAAAPAFKLELQGKVHYGSAIVCCVCVVLWQILEGLWDVTLWFGFVGGMLSLSMKDKWCWWMEWAVVFSLLGNLWRVV